MKFASAVKPEKGNEFLIDLADIKVDHSVNNRFAQADVAILVQSISQYGQLEAVGAVRVKPHNTLQLAYGYGRYEAIRRINESLPEDQRMKIRVTVFDGNERDVSVRNLAENAHRNDLTHMDYALAIRKLTELYGQTDSQIAQFFGRTNGWVSQHRALLSLGHTVQQKLHNGSLSFTDAYALTKVSEERQREIVAAVTALPPAEAAPAPAAEQPEADTVVETEAPAPEAKPEKEKKVKIKELVAKETGGKTRRTFAEMVQFFQIMIGSPACSTNLQRLAQTMLGIMNGDLDSDAEAVEALEAIVGKEEA